MWNMANTTTKKANATKKQNKNNFGLKTKKKRNKMMDVSPQTPKVL